MSEKQEYWINTDGYLVCGDREKNKWVVVIKRESYEQIPQKHIEPLSRIFNSHDTLLAALKAWKLAYTVYPTERTYYLNKVKELTRVAVELAEKGSAE